MSSTTYLQGLELLAQLGIFNPEDICWVKETDNTIHDPSCDKVDLWDAKPITFHQAVTGKAETCWNCHDKYVAHQNLDQLTLRQAQKIMRTQELIHQLETMDDTHSFVFAGELGKLMRTWFTTNLVYTNHTPALNALHHNQLAQITNIQEKHKTQLDKAKQTIALTIKDEPLERAQTQYFDSQTTTAQVKDLLEETIWLHFPTGSFIPDHLLAFTEIVFLDDKSALAKTVFTVAVAYQVACKNMVAIGQTATIEQLARCAHILEQQPQLNLTERTNLLKALKASHT